MSEDEITRLQALEAHHNLCREAAGAPDDDVLLERIKAMKAELAATKARLNVARLALEKIANGQTTKPWGNVVAKEALESIALDAPAGDANSWSQEGVFAPKPAADTAKGTP